MTKPLLGFTTTSSNKTNEIIPFRVRHTPTTIEFHHLGQPITSVKVLRLFNRIALELKPFAERTPSQEIAFGHFTFKLFNQDDQDIVSLAITDFHEIGKPIVYGRLFDVFKGIQLFFISRDHYQQLSFEVMVDGIGYVATGHLDHEVWIPSSNHVMLPTSLCGYVAVAAATTAALGDLSDKYQWDLMRDSVAAESKPQISLETICKGEAGFGAEIPEGKFLPTFEAATTLVRSVIQKSGDSNITAGLWKYAHCFRDGDNITFTIGDFREIGRPLIYVRLLDVLDGLPIFMIYYDRFREVYFEVEVEGEGSVGSGHVDFNNGPLIPPSAKDSVLNGNVPNGTGQATS
ncbi:MAG: hypothetical protein Q9217_003698 [Psora testacea]